MSAASTPAPGSPAQRQPGRYLRRLKAAPNPAYGSSPAARVGAGTMVFPPGAAFGPRKQAGYEVILLHRGGLVIDVDGADLRLAPGEVTLLRPGPWCTFRFAPDGETRVSYVATYEPVLPLPLLELLDVPPFTLPASRAMVRLIETILTLPDRTAGPAPMVSPVWLATASLALFADEALAAGLAGAGRAAAPEHPAIRAVRDLVRRRLSEPLRLRDMAEAAHVAPEHLVRLFRQRLGITPARYLWAARIRLGVHLLEHSDLPVAEIAARVGCQSPKHFARLVRAEVGVPPREVRRRTWRYAADVP
jgi:AraC-like DNA-binding protein/quercetin dioxygenase-like cupin family protein